MQYKHLYNFNMYDKDTVKHKKLNFTQVWKIYGQT